MNPAYDRAGVRRGRLCGAGNADVRGSLREPQFRLTLARLIHVYPQ